jgi:four helix bundle protein
LTSADSVKVDEETDTRATDNRGMLSFQKLDVYQRAIELLALALEIISKLPKGHGRLAGQLRESAQSTVSNITEGAGRRTRADAGHHYFMARGSAMESASHLDVMKVMAIVDADRYRQGIELCEGVVAMLTKMCDL